MLQQYRHLLPQLGQSVEPVARAHLHLHQHRHGPVRGNQVLYSLTQPPHGLGEAVPHLPVFLSISSSYINIQISLSTYVNRFPFLWTQSVCRVILPPPLPLFCILPPLVSLIILLKI